MPDLLWFTYQINIDDKQERSGDDPRFEFFFVNIFNNVARATVVDSGVIAVNEPPIRLRRSGPAILDQLRLHPPLAPTEQDPYLALCVRAFEYDDTEPNERAGSQDDVLARIEEMYNPELRAGRTPSGGDLWSVVNGRPIPTAGDEDELVGVSVRVWPNFGAELTRDGTRRTVTPTGAGAGDQMAFTRAGALWRMSYFWDHQWLAPS